MVGTGDMWEVPKSASDIKKGNYPTMDAPFKSYKCGERGSQIAIIDTMIKNVTDNIVQAQYIHQDGFVPNFCRNDELSSTMS